MTESVSASQLNRIVTYIIIYFLATQVNLTEGYLLMSCTSSKLSDEHPIEERFYLVTVDDITQLSMRAKLVVISGGWTVRNLDVDQRKLQSLVNAFVMAGWCDMQNKESTYFAFRNYR